MKKVLVSILLVILAAGLIFGGCTQTAPAPETETPEAPPAAPAEVVELKFSHSLPPVSPQVAPWMDWGKQVEELTDGQVVVTFYPASSLVPMSDDVLQAIQAGVCDIAADTAWIHPEFEFETIFNLPFLGWTNENVLNVRKQVEEAVPQIAEGRAGFKTLWVEVTTLENMHFVEKVVHVPADIEGMSLIAPPTADPFFKAFGVVSSGINPADHYGALEKGMVDGIIMNGIGMYEWKMDEVTKAHLYVPVSTSAMDIIMNLEEWNSLSPELQGIIEGTLAEAEQADYAAKLAVDIEMHDKLAAMEGHTVVEPTAEELALWEEKSQAVHEGWIAQMEEKGYPAQAAYDKLMEVIAQYK